MTITVKTWLIAQFDWFKGFFEETAGQPNKPSHKNLVVLAATCIFLIAFMRTIVATAASSIPDIPVNWLAFFLGALGIRAAQSVFETRAREKKDADPPPPPDEEEPGAVDTEKSK